MFPQFNALIIRKNANTLRASVYEQIIWAIERLGLRSRFKIPKSETSTLPSTVSPVVYGHATTYSIDVDRDGLGGSGTPKYAFKDNDSRLMVSLKKARLPLPSEAPLYPWPSPAFPLRLLRPRPAPSRQAQRHRPA